jgi:hypothetical protein
MQIDSKVRPLKVCYTCRHWSDQYKGLCVRLNQGVGKFWICEAWLVADAPHLAENRPAKPSCPTPPQPTGG